MSWLLPELEHLEIYITTEPNTGCWLWLRGPENTKGYYNFKHVGIHRVFYFCYKGIIPDEYDVHHSCTIRCCVNPQHLYILAHDVHSMLHDKNQNTNKNFCIRGHQLSGNNLIIDSQNYRQCKKCSKQRYRNYYEKKKRDAA